MELLEESLKDVPAADLGAIVIKEAVNRAGIKPELVNEVVMGNVIQAGLGQNVARQAAVKAGLTSRNSSNDNKYGMWIRT